MVVMISVSIIFYFIYLNAIFKHSKVEKEKLSFITKLNLEFDAEKVENSTQSQSDGENVTDLKVTESLLRYTEYAYDKNKTRVSPPKYIIHNKLPKSGSTTMKYLLELKFIMIVNGIVCRGITNKS